MAAKQWRWVLVMAAAGLSSYSAYRVYRLLSITAKGRKLVKLFTAIFSAAEAISFSADSVSLLSSDLDRFLRSDSDEIPQSFKQLTKMARFDGFSSSISVISNALTVGIVRGAQSASGSSSAEAQTSSSFSDRFLDKLFSDKGSGFASAMVGSFARSLVMAFCCRGKELSSCDETDWVDLMCSDRCRELIAENIQIFVRTAVSVYLEKTKMVNTYDALFSGLTNPKYESKVKDVFVSVCKGAIETLVKSSHKVLTNSTSSSSKNGGKDVIPIFMPQNVMGSDETKCTDCSGWTDHVSSVLAVPSNRQFALHVTGRVAFEFVRSFLQFIMWNMQNGMKRSVNVVNEKVIQRGIDAMKYLCAKAMFAISLCIAVCMGVGAEPRVLLAA